MTPMLPDNYVAQFLQETKPLSWYEKKQRLMEFYQGIAHYSGTPFVLRCEFGGGPAYPLDGHHWMLNNEKRWAELANTVLNMALIEHGVHIARAADNNQFREVLLKRKIQFWGVEPYREWFAAWPLVFKQTRRPLWNMMERHLG